MSQQILFGCGKTEELVGRCINTSLAGYFLLFYGAYYPLFWLAWIIRKRFSNVQDKGKATEFDLWE